ncbi:hypothetical protein [Shewanella mangrovisoli]|uniref:hypothetical protein n=1 Tax=Shewanella mangrovisoli TaxID=2864211 RepID=UPI001C65CAEE|nr:hypothetical protein [Shewanella mangrovisoli]QYK07595.1 hypothetical protein K0H60_12175 [Shewanella mangrovisoli]
MATCYHWGGSNIADCRTISPDIVYQDKNGHHFCLLHTPKYYIAAKGFFIGEKAEYNPKSRQFDKSQFDKQIEVLIEKQQNEQMIRFDKIYFPESYPNTFDSCCQQEKIFQFNGCYNLGSFSNGKIKSLRINNCEMDGFHAHNMEIEELLVTSSTINRRSELRDSKIGTMVFHTSKFDCRLRINRVEWCKENIYSCSIYFDEMIFSQDVEINNVKYNDNSEFRIVNSVFDKNLYYHDNEIRDFINFKYCKFNGGKAYLENIDARKIKLSSLNLEYLRFTNCKFPDKYKEIEDDSTSKAEEIYRELKKIAFDQRDYSLVSKWHFLEKEMATVNARNDKNYLVYFFLITYKYLSGYGEKPSQAIISLCIYISFVLGVLSLVGVAYTGFGFHVNWSVVRSIFFSLRDFLPFFVMPTKETLLSYIEGDWLLLIMYNFLAGFGRLYCVVQVALLTFAIRNKMKR